MSSLSLEGIEFLTSERGQAALARELPAEGLAALTALRGEGFSPAEAGWLLEQRELRARAERKLPAADVARMLQADFAEARQIGRDDFLDSPALLRVAMHVAKLFAPIL